MDNRDKNKHIVVDENPWPGLSSYEDPDIVVCEGRTPKLFCGRDGESHSVTQLIAGNIFVTLYGRSGIGKTSLLNAGVFPRLRQKRYLPVSIRLSMDAIGISFQQCIIKKISQTVIPAEGQQHPVVCQHINVVPLPADDEQVDYLWAFFARTRFLDADGRTVFPVIVFDQFEEVFRYRRIDAEILLRQIAYLMDESHALAPRMVDRQPYHYDFNFRFVASIREDDLYRLEDSIDNHYLSELKRCRYRLRSLSKDGARDAILIPGEGLFHPNEQKQMVQAIINITRNVDDMACSTTMLSFLCSRIFTSFIKLSNSNYIRLSLIEDFIQEDPFERFYDEATSGLSNREKSYIENNLVDNAGRRNSILETNFLVHVKNGIKLWDGESRILQRFITSPNGSIRITLVHDVLCSMLINKRIKRTRQSSISYLFNSIKDIIFKEDYDMKDSSNETNENPYIFISYNRKDLDTVKRIQEEIERVTSSKCWIDLKDIESGEQFKNVIIEAIKKTYIFLFMLSKNSQEPSSFPVKELVFAKSKEKEDSSNNRHVVLVNIDNCEMNDLFQFDYGNTNIIYYNERTQREKLIANLQKWIDKIKKSGKM